MPILLIITKVQHFSELLLITDKKLRFLPAVTVNQVSGTWDFFALKTCHLAIVAIELEQDEMIRLLPNLTNL